MVFRLCIKHSPSAWVGKDDGTSLGDNEFGSTNALPIWLDFMNSSKDKLSNYSIDVPEELRI